MRLLVARLIVLWGFAAAWPVAWAADAPGTPPAIPEREVAVWPQWRGPTRDGQVAGAAWPDRLQGAALQPLWRVALGPSYSGPIVAEDLIFVTETRDARTEHVQALDRRTGEQRWEVSWEGALSVPFFAKANGDWIRATPAYDGECMYVAGIRDVLVCLDADTGQERWRVDFVKQHGAPLPAFGFVASPLVDETGVYVQAGAAVFKLDKRTGQQLWRSLADEGGMQGSAFASPFMAEVAGRRQLLVQTRRQLAGVNPDDGAVLWSEDVPAFQGMNILTPTVLGDAVFTSAYGGKSLMFNLQTAEKLVAQPAWTSNVTGYMSSPVIIQGHIYMHLRNQRFTCLDAATGETRWTTQPYGKYWSLVANGDRMLALDERGELLLIRANPEKFELLDSRKVSDDPAWAHLAVCGDELFVRELNAMAAYRWAAASESGR